MVGWHKNPAHPSCEAHVLNPCTGDTLAGPASGGSTSLIRSHSDDGKIKAVLRARHQSGSQKGRNGCQPEENSQSRRGDGSP